MIPSKFGTSAARRRRTVPGVELGVRGFPVSRRGLVRRLACGLLASLLVVHSALFPVRARATLAAGALTAVGFAVTVTAFLNLAGIYPFNPDTGEGLTFPEWTDDALQRLINLYNVSHVSAPLTRQTVKSYALGATIAVANEGWNRLRDFVDWIKSKYAPADNVEGVQLGVVSGAGLAVPFVSAPYYGFTETQGYDYIVANGMYVCQSRFDNNYPVYSAFFLAFDNFSNASVFYVRNSSGVRVMVLSLSDFSSKVRGSYLYGATKSVVSASSSLSHITIDGAVYDVYGYANYVYSVIDGSVPGGQIVYDSNLQALRAFLGLGGSHGTFSGIIADTATVATPAAPTADSEFTGMQVAGLGQGATVDALEDVVESGVQNREQPTVRQVEVEVQAGTEVDSETGEVVENPVVVTPDSVPLVASDFSIPGLHTVFPFSIPWDIYNIYSALNATPVRPSFDASLYIPVVDVTIPFKIEIPDEISESVDNFAALVRSLLLVLMCIGTLLFVRNLIR